MADKEKAKRPAPEPEAQEKQNQEPESPEAEAQQPEPQEPETQEAQAQEPQGGPQSAEDEGARKLAEAEDKYLRLAAEYDNYRKRTAREKENAWAQAAAETVAAFLPVYDNLERALKQTCADEAYAKGVDMTMKGLQDVLTKLGVEVIPALGETFDPNRHNAVMHVDDESAGENTIVEVFQQGFMQGEKVIRFAMVKVAN